LSSVLQISMLICISLDPFNTHHGHHMFTQLSHHITIITAQHMTSKSSQSSHHCHRSLFHITSQSSLSSLSSHSRATTTHYSTSQHITYSPSQHITAHHSTSQHIIPHYIITITSHHITSSQRIPSYHIKVIITTHQITPHDIITPHHTSSHNTVVTHNIGPLWLTFTALSHRYMSIHHDPDFRHPSQLLPHHLALSSHNVSQRIFSSFRPNVLDPALTRSGRYA